MHLKNNQIVEIHVQKPIGKIQSKARKQRKEKNKKGNLKKIPARKTGRDTVDGKKSPQLKQNSHISYA